MYLRETYWIQRFNSMKLGYNATMGGQGRGAAGTWKHSEQTKLKISVGHKGKRVSIETKERIRAKVKQLMNDDYKALISKRTKEALLGKREILRERVWNVNKERLASAKYRESMKDKWALISKRIRQYTLSGEFVAEFASAKDAQRATGINHGNMCSCARGIKSQAGGFVWKYVAA
jgi:hypothetical protein